MEERRADNIMASILLAVSIAYFIQSLGYNHFARALPELISGVTIAILIIYLVTVNWAGFRLRSARDMIAEKPQAPKRESTGSLPMGLALPAIYLGTYVLLGILPSVFLFIAGYTWRFGKAKWYRAVAIGVIVDLVVYALFLGVLKYPIYQGLLLSGL